MASREGEDGTLYINDQQHPIVSRDDLLRHLDVVRREEYAEIRLVRWGGSGAEGTLLLSNRAQGRAYLQYQSDEKPFGFHALSDGREDEWFEFLLSNGQEDEWTGNETVPLDDALNALVYAFVNGGQDPFIQWHDDF